MSPGSVPAGGGVTLHHVGLSVSDLDATRQFYVEVLGMREIDRPADITFPGAHFRLGKAEIHVVVETQVGRANALRPLWSSEQLRTGYTAHLAFGVSDLEPILSQLAESGATFVGGPRIRADDVEQWYVADPDGHILELICQLDEDIANRRRRELELSGEAVPVAPGR